MRCTKVGKLAALLAGNELSAKKAAKVRTHLEKCAACRRMADETERALRAAKAMARAEEAGDWTAAEWRTLLKNITAEKPARKTAWAGGPLKPVLAGALVLFFIVAGAFLFLGRSPVKTDARAGLRASSQNPAQPARPSDNPDVSSVTIVSKKTGLKIIWFYNKNFEGEGYGK